MKDSVPEAWVAPCFSQVYHVLKENSYCVSFYGWQHIEKLMTVWKLLGFFPVAHLVWQKRYPSKRGVAAYMHEQAFVLAKGYPPAPRFRLPDVLPWQYSGNQFHPTEKAVSVMKPIILHFSKPGDIMLDPYEQSAMGDLLGEDFGLVQIDKLYRCLDKLLPHKRDLFTYLQQRWQALFHVGFKVLLYDLTSTYFESEPPEGGMRKFGYSRDKRPDCVQVVIALVVTPEGFPLAYEVMPGNTSDKTTLADFLKSSSSNTERPSAPG